MIAPHRFGVIRISPDRLHHGRQRVTRLPAKPIADSVRARLSRTISAHRAQVMVRAWSMPPCRYREFGVLARSQRAGRAFESRYPLSRNRPWLMPRAVFVCIRWCSFLQGTPFRSSVSQHHRRPCQLKQDSRLVPWNPLQRCSTRHPKGPCGRWVVSAS